MTELDNILFEMRPKEAGKYRSRDLSAYLPACRQQTYKMWNRDCATPRRVRERVGYGPRFQAVGLSIHFPKYGV